MTFLDDADIEYAVAMAAQLAHHYVGTPEAAMLLDLHGVRSQIETELANDVGPAIAGTVANAFVAAVVARRREIEGAVLH